jgi:hypothetical protein
MLSELFESPHVSRNYATVREATCLRGLLNSYVRRAMPN